MPIICNKYIVLCYRILIVIVSFLGLYFNFGSGNQFKLFPLLSYFTILSNLFAFIYFSLKVIKSIINIKDYRDDYNVFYKGSLVVCLLVTFIVFHYILKPMTLGMINAKYFMSIGNILVHYVTPLMVLIDWLLINPRDKINYPDAFKWITFPFIYWLFTIFNAAFGYTYASGSHYPYFFLDIDKYGVLIVVRNVLVIGILFLLLGMLLVFVDKKIFNYKKSLSSKKRK